MNDITLSVGMIVKNEGAALGRCLSALRPILAEISGEIVIVDTGSTDNTPEIARKFTDKIFHFDWIDDFSAARNFGLSKCVGKWFMFTDADEVFDEDISAFVEFFRKYEDNYLSATINRLDYYSDSNVKTYALTRLFCREKLSDAKFEGRVHENFGNYAPMFNIDTKLHHWGYYNEKAAEKGERNLPLMLKELEEHPDDVRMYMHILESGHEIPFMYRTLRFLETYKAPPEFIYAPIYEKLLFAELARAFWLKNYFDDCIEIYRLFRAKYPNSSTVDVKIFPLVGSAYFNLKRYAEAATFYDVFFQAAERYEKGDFEDFADVRFVRGDDLTPDVFLTQIHKGNFETARSKIGEKQPGVTDDDYDIYYDLLSCVGELSERILSMPKNVAAAQLTMSATLHQTRFPAVALDFTRNTPTKLRQTLKGVDFLANLLEKAVLSPTDALKDDEKADLYYAFAEQLIILVTNVYNPYFEPLISTHSLLGNVGYHIVNKARTKGKFRRI